MTEEQNRTGKAGHDLLLSAVNAYYSAKVAQHGPIPGGVDWRSQESQELRFVQLLRICSMDSAFSLNDYGCGYGALYGFLKGNRSDVDYRGWDLSEEMVSHARLAYGTEGNAEFDIGSAPARVADYTVASGIFNVRLQASEDVWLQHILACLDLMNASSRRGFSFNCLTIYSDRDRMRDYLYYADPCRLFDHCKRRYARDVALLHDYGLYEFTILVRKQTQPVGAR